MPDETPVLVFIPFQEPAIVGQQREFLISVNRNAKQWEIEATFTPSLMKVLNVTDAVGNDINWHVELFHNACKLMALFPLATVTTLGEVIGKVQVNLLRAGHTRLQPGVVTYDGTVGTGKWGSYVVSAEPVRAVHRLGGIVFDGGIVPA